MKLHLPKLLCLAVLSTLTVNADDLTYSADKTTYNIGTGTGTSILSGSNIVIGDGVSVGVYDSAGNLINDVASVNDPRTNNLEVKGDLTITGNGQVVVAGREASSKDMATLTADNVYVQGNEGNDEVVNLNASVLKTNTLTISSGNVMLHGATTSNSDFTQGNGFLGNNATDFTKTPKQAQIFETLNIAGGELTVGVKADPAYVTSSMHYVMGFGERGAKVSAFGVINFDVPNKSCTINHSGGEMKVYGDTVAQSGFTINQTVWSDGKTTEHKESLMILRDNLAVVGDGKMSVNQSNDNATLVIGRIVDDNYVNVFGSGFLSAKVEMGTTSAVNVIFNQTGAGDIQLASGTDFKHKGGTVSINQSGGGTFTIGGGIAKEYQPENGMDPKRVAFTNTNTTYQITQNGEAGGHLIIKEGEIIASSVNQTVGTISVEGNASLSAGEITAGGAVISGDVSGDVVLTDGAISTAEKNVTISGNLNAYGIVVNSGMVTNDGVISVGGQIVLNAGTTLVNNGTIKSASTVSMPYALMTAEEQAAAANLIIVEAGATLDNSKGKIESSVLVDGGTVTLGTGTTQDITMNDGIIYVTGKVETGDLTLQGGSLIFEEGATVVLDKDDIVDLSGAKIVINVDDITKMEETPIVNLFQISTEGDVEGGSSANITNWEGTTVTFKDVNNNTVTGTVSGSVEGGGLSVTIPEPATATLSLLALAGLAMRRRRVA